MADDHVTIDPQFRSSPSPRGDRPSTLGWIGAVAAVAVAFGLVWLLGTAAPGEPNSTEETPSSAAQPMAEITPSTAPPSSPLAPSRYLGALDVPLADVVPGFTDEILMLTTPTESFNVVRWPASSPVSDVLLTLDRDGSAGWPLGLDASGYGFAEVRQDAVVVHSVPGRASHPRGSRAVTGRVASPVWHATEPQRLAWFACPEEASGSATLLSLDTAEPAAEPTEVFALAAGCPDAWLERWGSWGALIHDGAGGLVLVDADENQVFPIAADGRVIGADSDGFTLWVEPSSDDRRGEIVLVGAGGEHERVVPGPAAGRVPHDAAWSPDGNRLALTIGPAGDPTSELRIVDSSSGRTLTAIVDVGAEPITMAWSDDGRFLVFESWSEADEHAELVFCDTAGHTTTSVSLSEIVDEIRVHESQAPPRLDDYAELDSPADWPEVGGADLAPHPGGAEPPADEAGRPEVAATSRLALGEVAALPDSPRLDFLNAVCRDVHECFRDAVVIDPDDDQRGSGVWGAGVPFHVRHGFVNETGEPLGREFDVVVYVTRVTGPTADSQEAAVPDSAANIFELGETYRFSSDYVLQGTAERCGPGYWEQTDTVTCEWFVHDFADGLPPGRYDIWTKWFAPCWAWQELGFVEACPDPAQIDSHFASSVNMPFNDRSGDY